MNNNFTKELNMYLQSGDICAYLDIRLINKVDKYNLTEKMSSLDMFMNSTLLNSIFSSFYHQMLLAKCSFEFQQNTLKLAIHPVSVLYEQQGAMSLIMPFIILPAIFALISIIFNVSIIIVAVKKIPFIKLCNSLILFDSFCQILVVFPFLINFCGFIFQLASIDYRICVLTLMLSTGCSYAALLAIFFISLERLLNTTFPIRMHFILPSTIKKCSIFAFIICTIFGVFMTLKIFNVLNYINIPYYRFVYCNSALYTDVLNNVTSHILLGLSILNYSLIFFKFLWRHFRQNSVNLSNEETSMNNKESRRLLRSVIIITMVLSFGWVLITFLRNKLTQWTVDLLKWIFNIDQMAFPIFVNNITISITSFLTFFFIFTCSINAPVLIINSSEYRNAYIATFGWIWKRKIFAIGPLFNRVHPVSGNSGNNS